LTSLDKEIEKASSVIFTESYSMSIGEVLNLYKDGELDIHPEFQRVFRWSDEQKSKLIESLLLGIPLPSFFVSQRIEDGVWDVVDGVQRLSTIFQLTGDLRDEDDELLPRLELRATQYLPSLEGCVWEEPKKKQKELSQAQRLIIKRAKIDVKIIAARSGPTVKFDLFQRLNTLGSSLSPQETRNAIAVMIDVEFFEWLRDLAATDDFRDCVALSERLLDEKYDMELALRFILLRNLPLDEISSNFDITSFVTDGMTKIASSHTFDREQEEADFSQTFRLLRKAFAGECAFKRYDADKDDFVGPLVLSAFEVVGLGLGHHITEWREAKSPSQSILDLATIPWKEEKFVKGQGSGIRASSRLQMTLKRGRNLFKPE
jgi:hypothetical protein